MGWTRFHQVAEAQEKAMAFVFRFLGGGRGCFALCYDGRHLETERLRRPFCRHSSVALATLALTIHSGGTQSADLEVRSMIAGPLLAALTIWVGVSISVWVLRRHLRHRLFHSKAT
jgi:hypothetical protein